MLLRGISKEFLLCSIFSLLLPRGLDTVIVDSPAFDLEKSCYFYF